MMKGVRSFAWETRIPWTCSWLKFRVMTCI